MSVADEVNSWMNYRARTLESGQVLVICEDHRAVLPVIALARAQGLFEGSPTLLRLDRHMDYVQDAACSQFTGIQPVGDVKVLADLQVKSDDSSWLRVAVHADYVSNVATWFVDPYEPGANGVGFNTRSSQQDINGKHHQLWFTGSLSNWIAELKDATVWANDLAADCGFTFAGGVVELSGSHEFWLDIDLDFAASTVDHSCVCSPSRPWTVGEFESEFRFPQPGRMPLLGAIDRAKLITISTEPVFCGGYSGSAYIMSELRRLFSRAFDW